MLKPIDAVGIPVSPTYPIGSYGFAKFITIPITTSLNPSGINIPAGNIVSCFYTFVPGGTTYTLGIPFYSFDPAIIPTVNGFCGTGFMQNNSTLVSMASYKDHQVDKDSWNAGIVCNRTTRYNNYPDPSFNSMAFSASFTVAPIMWFSIKGYNSAVGLNELELDNKDFILEQNIPNPYQSESKVRYKISKDSKSAIFKITDVTGRIVLSKNVDSNNGKHEIDIPSYAPGIYYYSLNVDGSITTNKMIVQ
ncbi:MAG: T9SS type A sorting domain-containing protein [Bacteroidota bacterium]